MFKCARKIAWQTPYFNVDCVSSYGGWTEIGLFLEIISILLFVSLPRQATLWDLTSCALKNTKKANLGHLDVT